MIPLLKFLSKPESIKYSARSVGIWLIIFEGQDFSSVTIVSYSYTSGERSNSKHGCLMPSAGYIVETVTRSGAVFSRPAIRGR